MEVCISTITRKALSERSNLIPDLPSSNFKNQSGIGLIIIDKILIRSVIRYKTANSALSKFCFLILLFFRKPGILLKSGGDL